MFPIPSNEHLVENKICKQCSISFPITDKDMEFYEKVSPVFAGKKYQIPTPTLCPGCRQQRRLSFRNERKLYRRNCDATGKSIISIYSPDKPFKIYHQDFWWSDAWDPMDYGVDFDFSRGFFEQIKNLSMEVPLISLIIQNGENSDYTNYTSNHTNCYMTVGGEVSKNCMYGNYQFYTDDSLDFYWITKCDNCYETQHSSNCHNLYYSKDCKNTSDAYFCSDCNNCHHCIGCHNLTNASYQVFNKPVTEEEYTILVGKLSKRSFLEEFKIQFYTFLSKEKYKFADIATSENCSGDIITSSKNCLSCFSVDQGDTGKDIAMGFNFHDAYDTTLLGFESSKVIGSLGIMSGNNIYFTTYAWNNNSNLLYSMHCYNNCSHLFGCIGLRNKSYCIFNKQYTKEEYEALVPKIIEHMQKTGEWGEFFPSSLSPFGYNETVAQEYFPLTKSEAIQDNRFNWSDYEAPFPKVEKIIPAAKLPEDISQIPDDILNWAIECEVTKKPFRIISQELEFYRKHNISIPRRHPDQRHLDRMTLRNPRKLFERKCDCCEKMMITTYAPERTERVYCESCYLEII